jgi:sterol desaturase/sphingolipid hydroxylase (fatty acid hydroxylase superfamily)
MSGPQQDDVPSDLVSLARAHGGLNESQGLLSGVLALGLGLLSVLAVLAYRFPAYLTTPELRKNYDPEQLRYVLSAALVVSGGISLVNILTGRSRWLASWAFGFVLLSLLLGGSGVPVGDFPDHTPYVGVDWLVLDLLGSALVFVFIEKLFALRKDQPIFREAWQTDLTHFAVNHLMIGLSLLVVNHTIQTTLGWTRGTSLQDSVSQLPFAVSLFLCVLCADLMQYWTHRAYHEIPLLWRLHAVHHSTKHMDWIAGSRQHLLELFITRILVLAPIFALGFSQEVVDSYIVIVGFQAVFNHANVSVRLGPLSYLIVTPNFHHWHHSRDTEAIDRNYAAHFAFLDHIFGTAVRSDRTWPDHYGVVGDYVPRSYLGQLLFPFGRHHKSNPQQ